MPLTGRRWSTVVAVEVTERSVRTLADGISF
jgi:hypothetical protein